MSKFKILNNPQQSFYFDKLDEESANNEYYDYYCHFEEYNKKAFLNELKKHDNIKKQAGYSKKRDCNYISIIIAARSFGDGEFRGHSIRSTCLVEQNGKIKDSNDITSEHGEVGYVPSTIYHHLPDGKIVEYKLEKSYEDDLENIYKDIIKIRSYYELNEELPVKDEQVKTKKFKV